MSYAHVGPVSKFPELCQIWQGIVNKQQYWAFSGCAKPVGHFAAKNLYYVDHDGVRYVEQNPHTSSPYASRARQGAQIVWCIRLSDNQYLGYIENGEVYMQQQVAAAS